MASDPDLSSPEESEQKLEDKAEESSSGDDRGDRVYQTLDRPEPVYALPRQQAQVRFYWKILQGLDPTW